MAHEAEPREARPGPDGPRPQDLSALLQEVLRGPEERRGGGWEDALRPGAVVGRFELVKELGRGGFGVVWEAKDRELGRSVAFKAVRASARPEIAEERLLREAEAAARVSHPNLVTLFELGRSEHGPYLILELLHGRTLEDRLAQGSLSVREAIRIGAEVAKGAAHAHAHGVFHRDLKPANVFLCDGGQVKVLDFGLAHAFGQRRQDGGTPAYMAPEQWEGSPEDERTDVFALGVMLYRMLSGELPFPDDGGKAVKGTGKAPSLEVRELPALGELVARMLAKRPVDRPRDGGEVGAALHLLAQELDRTPSSGTATVRTRRRPGLRLAGLLAAALIVGAVTAALVVWLRTPPSPSASPDGRLLVAVADVVNETGEKDLDVLSGLLVTSLEQSHKLSVMTQARVLDLAARAGRRDAARVDETLGREVGRAHAVRALLLPAIRKLGATYSLEMRAIDPGRDRHLFTLSDRATSKDALLDVLDRLSDGARKRLGEGAADVAEASVQLGEAMTRSVEAYEHYAAGVEAWYRDGLRAAGLRAFLEAVRLDPRFAAAHFQAGWVYLLYGRPDLAATHIRAAKEHLDRMPEKEQGLLRMHLAYYYYEHERRDPAEAARLAGALGARFPDDKFILAQTAVAYLEHDIDRKADAERVLRRALSLDPGFSYAGRVLATVPGIAPADRVAVARRAVATRRSAANLALLADAELMAGNREAAGEAAREAVRVDGAQNSLNLTNACAVLDALAGRPACVAEWRRLLQGGPNEHERDVARLKLVSSLAAEGRRREALHLLRTVPEERRGEPWELGVVLAIGLRPASAIESRAALRRSPWPLLRRYGLAAWGAVEEAERISAALEPGERSPLYDQFYAPLRLAAQGRHAEAAEIQRRNLDWLREHEDNVGAVWHAYLLAELLLAAGRPEEAASVEPRFSPGGYPFLLDHAQAWPPLALVRARAMERLGRTADARRELDGVIAYWKDADPDLPLLVEAKAMRARLATAR